MMVANRLHPSSEPAAASAFLVESGGNNCSVSLLVMPLGSRASPTVVWSRPFDDGDDRDAFLDAVHSTRFDLTFLGRLTTIFGGGALDALSDRIVLDARDAWRKAADAAAERAERHRLVILYTAATKRGFMLELRRASRDTPDWTVTYTRAIERDRLCDWLKWQRPRFLTFLDHAALHGDEALARLLTDEMFATERRVKQEGRGAGGNRPLRMWRGD